MPHGGDSIWADNGLRAVVEPEASALIGGDWPALYVRGGSVGGEVQEQDMAVPLAAVSAGEGVADGERIKSIICAPQYTWNCEEALAVAWCESRLDPRARNGQYLGTFQMGAAERARFGHGRTVETQARAALRYYRVSGWRPWACA